MNTLYIDTRDNKRIIVRLKTKNSTFEEESKASKDKAQATLPLIKKVLERAKIKTEDIAEIQIETGPGSFTGLRVGISIANAISFASLIKINGKKIGDLEVPRY
jgi:tRNA threonylcarbamoyladenosine biosynthesis protein TsaB